MDDINTPGGQTPPNQQVDWEARYKGLQAVLQPKYDAAISENRTLTERIATLTSEVEQLKLQSGTAGAERDRVVADLTAQVSTLTQQNIQLSAQLTPLDQLNKKVRLASTLGLNDLLPVIEHIPYMDNEEALKEVMSNFAKIGDAKVRAREQQLLGGVTPTTAPLNQSPALPTTSDGWRKYTEDPNITRQERDNRFAAWRTWGVGQGKINNG